MSADHKNFITKQIEKWGKTNLAPVSAQRALLTRTLIDAVAYSKSEQVKNQSPEQVISAFESDHRSASLRDLSKNYSNALNYWKLAFDEDARYLSVNIKYNIQAVIFRILTTLAIGFSIMLVYWVAHCFGIPMPLLRLPV